MFVLIASNRREVQAIDVKTAFFQGKQIERTVYLWPLPKEANTNKIWRPPKFVYGLAEASRYWHLRVKEELIKLGANVSSVDSGLFYWKEHYKLVDMLVCHVDDMVQGGNETLKSMLLIILRALSCLVQKKQKLSHTWAYNQFKMMILV